MCARECKLEIYCLSKLSILRDLCSILVIMACALSASTNSAISALDDLLLGFDLGQIKILPLSAAANWGLGK